MLKICQRAYKVLLIVLLGLLGICVWQSFFYIDGKASLEQYNPFILLLGMSILIFGGIAIARFLSTCSKRTLTKISKVLFTLIALKLIFFGVYLIYIPQYDLIHITTEAVSMLETGKIENIPYYAKYPNQQPLTILLYFVFSGAKFIGITDYNMVGVAFNIFAIFLSAWFVYKICCLWSLKSGVIGLLFFIVDPMLFIWVSNYYTDTICMPFMLGGVYLFLRTEKINASKTNFLLFILSAFIIFIGGQIRVTSAFVLIAFVLNLLIKSSLRTFFKKFFAVMIGVICAAILCNFLLATYGVKDKKYEYPITHWLKLGVNEASNGAYTMDDDDATMEEPTYEKKVEENIGVIKERLKEMGVSGLEKLYLKKMAKVWSTAAYTESMQERVEDYNILFKYTIGRSSIVFKYWKQIVRCGILLLAFIGAIFEIRRKGFQDSWMFITIFGGIIFYIFWEQKSRYSLCFLPIFYLIETYSLTYITEMRKLVYIKIKRQGYPAFYFNIERKKRMIKSVCIFVVLYTILIGGISYSKYVSKKDIQKDLIISQRSYDPKETVIEIDAEKGITQSFVAQNDFNTIEVSFFKNNHIVGQNYVLNILDDEKHILCSREFSSDDITSNKLHTFEIDKISSDMDKFYLNILPCNLYQQNISVNTGAYTVYTGYKKSPDYYSEGFLYVGNKKYSGNDLVFVVSNQYEDSILSSSVFFVILGIVLIAELFLGMFFYENAAPNKLVKKRDSFLE